MDAAAIDWAVGLRPVGCCDRRCRLSKVRVPGPVLSITEVKIDGVALDPSAYRLKRARVLERLDGSRWPCAQNLTLPDTEADTFSIKYIRGADIPPSGTLAATQLAGVLCDVMCGGDCGDMSVGLTDVSREGNHWTFDDPVILAKNGKTGVHVVDQWLMSVNPYGRRRSAAIFGVEDIGR